MSQADNNDSEDARPHLRIEVEWSKDRKVPIDVVIEPALTHMREGGGHADALDSLTGTAMHDFDRDVLRGEHEFVDALRRWTISAKESEVVHAQCVDFRLPDLLARLKATPPIPETIPFALP